MRTNIANVIRAFQNHQTCNEKTCSTDGERIYSYNMEIARRGPLGVEIIEGKLSPSKTTTCQINAVRMSFANHSTFRP